jgi:hypothetical protein
MSPRMAIDDLSYKIKCLICRLDIDPRYWPDYTRPRVTESVLSICALQQKYAVKEPTFAVLLHQSLYCSSVYWSTIASRIVTQSGGSGVVSVCTSSLSGSSYNFLKGSFGSLRAIIRQQKKRSDLSTLRFNCAIPTGWFRPLIFVQRRCAGV